LVVSRVVVVRCCDLVVPDAGCAVVRESAFRAAGVGFGPPQARRPIRASPARQVLVMRPLGGGVL
jgi:hypothetical protein